MSMIVNVRTTHTIIAVKKVQSSPPVSSVLSVFTLVSSVVSEVVDDYNRKRKDYDSYDDRREGY